jgi:HAMP domain-containing protein
MMRYAVANASYAQATKSDVTSDQAVIINVKAVIVIASVDVSTAEAIVTSTKAIVTSTEAVVRNGKAVVSNSEAVVSNGEVAVKVMGAIATSERLARNSSDGFHPVATTQTHPSVHHFSTIIIWLKQLHREIMPFQRGLLNSIAVIISHASFIHLHCRLTHMTRKKRTSRMLEKAELRSAGLKAVDPTLNFGDTRTLTNLTTQIEQLRTKIDAYNTALAIIDSSKTEIEALEKSLGDLTDQMLIGVAFKYGKNSREYEMAGGVRKSERIRRSMVSRLKAGVEESAAGSSVRAV